MGAIPLAVRSGHFTLSPERKRQKIHRPPPYRPNLRHRRRHVDPPGMRVPRRDPPRPRALAQPPARPRINRPLRPMRRGQARLNVAAGAETGVEQPHLPQPIQCRRIRIQPLRLEYNIPIPRHAQPGQILDDPRHMLGPAARSVNILDPQAKAAASVARHVHGQQCRPAMADMQPPRRAGGKAGHHIR